jgi:hypothetical protein
MQQKMRFADGLHKSVFNTVMDHLNKVTGTARPNMGTTDISVIPGGQCFQDTA